MTAAGALRVLHRREALAALVAALARRLDAAYPNGVVLVAVLHGSLLFLADLIRRLAVPVEVEFLAISPYAAGTGRVRLVLDVASDLQGRDVVLVEDIVDTGLTTAYVVGELRRRQPRSLEVCTLFDRRARRLVPLQLRFVGAEAPDELLVGYGLDVEGRYRNLPFVAVGDPDRLTADPDAHVEELYGR